MGCGSVVPAPRLRAVGRIQSVQFNKEVQSVIDTVENLETILNSLKKDAEKLKVDIEP